MNSLWYVVLLCGSIWFLIHVFFVHRRLYCQRANTKKMFLLTITQAFGVHGGKTINGDIDVASRQFAIVTAQALLVLRLQRPPLIWWRLTLLAKKHVKVCFVDSVCYSNSVYLLLDWLKKLLLRNGLWHTRFCVCFCNVVVCTHVLTK